MRTDELFAFIKERHAIHERREAGKPKPWTDDPILQSYRFCNVYRELDTQTKWFAENWRKPNANDPDLWFASLVFRFINWSETAEELGYPVPFKAGRFMKILRQRKLCGKKVYNGAYMITTHGVKAPKNEYIGDSLDAIWNRRNFFRYKKGERLAEFHSRLTGAFDVGGFLAGQVIADTKHVGEMKKARDWDYFATSGPGSRRGLNRVRHRPVKSLWTEKEWCKYHGLLHLNILPLIDKAGMPFLDGQDLQNCLCEFDKYERVRLGEGRPKSRYPGV